MTRQVAAGDVTSFVKGLVTEASPLTFPANASIDEMNIVLNKDGSRRRRLGMDYEDSWARFSTGSSPATDLAFSTYVWKAPGGYTNKEFLVVQSGVYISIFDSTLAPISGNRIGFYAMGTDGTVQIAFTSVDGVGVFTSSTGAIYTLDYNGSTLTQSTGRLMIRDLFGVADVTSGVNLLSGNDISTRPASLTQAHTYNLRNQTFSVPRFNNDSETLTDPISAFFSASTNTKYPANSDSVVTFLYADANDSDDRNTRRYFSKDNFNNPLGTNRAPVGYFIIDALNRGASRLAAIQALNSQYAALGHDVTSLPTDSTPGGAACVGSYAGRVWFGGFSSQITGGDTESPRMTSYVLFSKLVKSVSDVFKCYQEGDPTSSETPDLVDTDGGFIRLDGAYNIKKIINVGETLMVVAENGIWQITGGSGYGFKATDYKVVKITEHGCISSNSVVVVDNTFMFWSDDGIYHVRQNQYGDWIADNLTTTTIQTLYDNIPYNAKVRCNGNYDSYQRRVRWLYNNYLSTDENAKELVFDINLLAFYQTQTQTINSLYPRPVAVCKVPAYTTESEDYTVVSGAGSQVINSAGANAIITQDSTINQTAELMYIIADSTISGILYLTIGYYKEDTFVDWKSFNGTGIDAAGYLLTGWNTGSADFQRMKQMPYLTVYSMKTETGFDVNFNPVNASSILVQGQWNWTNLAEGGKWTMQFQAYRHKRLWIPANSDSGFDDGDLVVVTRSRVRGRGRVLSLRFDTAPGKDFHLLGWSFVMDLNGNI